MCNGHVHNNGIKSNEKEGIINNVRSKVKSDGIPDTRENCW